MVAFEMLFESSEQPEVRRCQIRAVRSVWNHLISCALYRRWSGSTSVVCGVAMMMKCLFWRGGGGNRDWFFLCALLEASRKPWWWLSLIFCTKFAEVLPVQIVSCADRPSTLRLVVQGHISATIPLFSHPTMHRTAVHSYLHHWKPIIAGEFL
jgi:hypothetical protein